MADLENLRERLALLPDLLIVAIQQALTLRGKSALRPDEIVRSSFLNAYVCVYPGSIDEEEFSGIDPRLGSTIRFYLLCSVFNCSHLQAQRRFDVFRSVVENGDAPEREAFILAQDDGRRYFEALFESKDANRSTANLGLAIRGKQSFPPLIL